MRTGTLGIGALAVALAGCAHSGPLSVESSPTALVLHTQSDFVRAEVSPTGMQGPQFNLARTATSFRGTVFNRPVNADISPSRSEVSGILGTAPLKIQAQPEASGLHVTGLIGGFISDFVTSPASIKGRIGPCSYDLRFTGRAYEGFRSCRDRGVEQATLSVPPTLGLWKGAEMAAGLGLFLSVQGVTRSSTLAGPPVRPMAMNVPGNKGPRPPLH